MQGRAAFWVSDGIPVGKGGSGNRHKDPKGCSNIDRSRQGEDHEAGSNRVREPRRLVPYLDQAFIRQAAEWLGQADALLLGRRTYDAFARDWRRSQILMIPSPCP